MKKVYKSVNETGHVHFNLAERKELCSLENAVEVNIDGKLFCIAYIGQRKHKDARQLCQSLNATLPLPKSFKEQHQLSESFKRLAMDKKMNDFSTKIVIDVRRSSKGKVSLYLVFNLYFNDFAQLN